MKVFCLALIIFLGGTFTAAHAQSSKEHLFLPRGNPTAPRGGTFVYGRSEEPVSLNPVVADGHSAVDIQFHVVEPLANLDVETNDWIPALADHWRTLPDGKTYEFHLRPDARFSDGVPVTARDVKFSFDVLFDPAFPTAHMRPYYEGIARVEIVDRQTVRFHARNSYFLNFLTSAGLPIVPWHIYGDVRRGPNIHKTVIGSGPYAFESWEQGTRLSLKRNPAWWGYSDPQFRGSYNPDRIVFRFVGNEHTALEMLKRGEIDFLRLSAEAYYKHAVGRAWGRDAFKVKFSNAYPKSSEQIWWNLERPILSDVRVRRALGHLMDRDFVVRKFDFATTVASSGPWYPQSDFADPFLKPLKFDPAFALKILKEAGWVRGKQGLLIKNLGGLETPLRVTILISGKGAERYLTVYQRDARRAGVDIQFRYVDSSLLYPILARRDFDAIQTSGGGGLVDFDPKPTWHSSTAGQDGANLSGYRSRQVDALIDRARNTPNRARRQPLMREIFRRIAADAPALFVLNENESFYAYSARVGRPGDTFRYDIGTKYWWLKSAGEALAQVRR